MSCPRCGEPVPNMSNNHKCKGPEKLFEAGRAPLPRKEWKAVELHEIIEYLLVRLEEETADDCDCGTDEPGSCVICRAKAVLSGGGDERWEKEAPVAPVRKWEADRKAIA